MTSPGEGPGPSRRSSRSLAVLTDDVAEVLAGEPGSTAAQLTALLALVRPAAVRGRSPSAVELALLGDAGRFCSDRSLPPRWWLVGDPSAEESLPGAARSGGTPDVDPSTGLGLYAWQQDALDAWSRSGHRGVVEAVTGTGKTLLGLAAAARELAGGGQVLVLVPTIELMEQWRRHVRGRLEPTVRVGCLGGSETGSLVEHDLVVAVVNSARVADLHPIRRGGLLVADECHRYGSAMNRLALGERFERRLGLSATYAREDDGHLAWLDPYFGGTCFQMGYQRAVADDITARFSVALVGVELDFGERDRYDELTFEIGLHFVLLVERHGVVPEPFGEFLAAVSSMASGRGPSSGGRRTARAYLAALYERRRLLADTPSKLDALFGLVPAIRAAERSIVFTQSIAVSERACDLLGAASLRAGAVHSRMAREDRRAVLKRFASGDIDVISAPRVLDEGIDVPEADLAVVVGASRTRRQMVQRMGRVLRRKRDGRRARIAVLYVVGTVEDPAHGAHESFLSEVTDVADEVRDFEGPGHWSAAADFLLPARGAGAVTDGWRSFLYDG